MSGTRGNNVYKLQTCPVHITTHSMIKQTHAKQSDIQMRTMIKNKLAQFLNILTSQEYALHFCIKLIKQGLFSLKQD